jgi:hypothetical protein
MHQVACSEFLLKLQSSNVWRLYLPEIVFGYLKYMQEVESLWWNPDNVFPANIIESLIKDGKICILKPNAPVQVLDLPQTKTTVIATYNSKSVWNHKMYGPRGFYFHHEFCFNLERMQAHGFIRFVIYCILFVSDHSILSKMLRNRRKTKNMFLRSFVLLERIY